MPILSHVLVSPRVTLSPRSRRRRSKSHLQGRSIPAQPSILSATVEGASEVGGGGTSPVRSLPSRSDCLSTTGGGHAHSIVQRTPEAIPRKKPLMLCLRWRVGQRVFLVLVRVCPARKVSLRTKGLSKHLCVRRVSHIPAQSGWISTARPRHSMAACGPRRLSKFLLAAPSYASHRTYRLGREGGNASP